MQRRGLSGLVALLVIAALAWWIDEAPVAPRPAGKFNIIGPAPVVAAAVANDDVNIALNALGTVVPLATVLMKSQISGQLVHIAFQEGQAVKRGDLLAEIDSRPYEAALKQAQGQLARDEALLQDAELDVARYKNLVASNAIARQQLDTTQALVKQDEGTIAADQALIDNATLNIGYCHIRAPIDGRVGLRLVDEGNYVTPGDPTGIVVITQLHPITVIFTVPEDDLPAILKRLHAGATLPVTALDRSGTAQLATGTLTTLDNQIDATTGTVKLRAQFGNDDESLFPNQFVNIQLLVDMLHQVPVVPVSAIERGAPGTFVYIVNSDNSVTVRVIELGPASGGKVAVISGLSQGDKVVVDGADRLRDGAKITLRVSDADRAASDSKKTDGGQGNAHRRSQDGS